MPATFEVEAAAKLNGKLLPCRVLGIMTECYGAPETYLVEFPEGTRKVIQAKAVEFNPDRLQ
jgi:hypothetical protein